MAKFKQLYKIIEEVVDGINWDIAVNNNIDNGNGTHTLELDCTAYLNTCTQFTDISGNKWEVTEFVFNESITIKPVVHNNPFLDANIVLGGITFYHGTIKLTNAEYTSTMDKNDILPAIYLYESLSESVSLDVADVVERTTRIQLFILMSNDFENMIQVNYDAELFDPLSNIESKLFDGLKKSKNISKFTERYDRYNRDQFAYTDRNGELQRIFADELSALELQIPLNIIKCNYNNKC